MSGVEEAALIAAASEGLTAAEIGAAADAAILPAMMEGGSLLGGLGAGAGMGYAGSELATPGIEALIGGGESALLGNAFSPAMDTMLANAFTQNLVPQLTPAPLKAFAPMATTAAPGAAAGFGETLAGAGSAAKPLLSGRQALLLGQMAGSMGGGEERALGAPSMDAVPAYTRQGMRTQEEITKAWLLKNDPATYYRLYGQPQMAAGGAVGGTGYGY